MEGIYELRRMDRQNSYYREEFLVVEMLGESRSLSH
jgi:hypothetical protein